MAAIHGWPLRQDRDGVEDSFLCNWKLTLECQRTGELIVFIDPASQVPVAYQWGALLEPGILEVRADKRGTGIGRVMVEHRLADVRERNEDILFIQCTALLSCHTKDPAPRRPLQSFARRPPYLHASRNSLPSQRHPSPVLASSSGT